MAEDFKEVQTAVDGILNVKSYVRRKKRTELDKKKEMFVQMMNSMEEITIRQALMYADMDVDMFKYDEKFLSIIDLMHYLHYGEACAELIAFYLYDRRNADGTINALVDQTGQEILLENSYDLWNLMVSINPKIQE